MLAPRFGPGTPLAHWERLPPRMATPAPCATAARAPFTLTLEFRAPIETWERAYAAYRAQCDQLGAVRVARTLGFIHCAVMGDEAVMQGWLARAQTLLSCAQGTRR